MQIQTESGQPVQIQTESGQPVQIQTESGQPVQIQTESGQPVQIQTESGQPVQFEAGSTQEVRLETESGQEVQDVASSSENREENISKNQPSMAPVTEASHVEMVEVTQTRQCVPDYWGGQSLNYDERHKKTDLKVFVIVITHGCAHPSFCMTPTFRECNL